MDLEILPANIEDLPVLADLNQHAYSEELASRFAWENWPDPTNQQKLFSARLALRFNDDTSQIFKAVLRDSLEIIGFICWTLEGENEEAGTPEHPLNKAVSAIKPSPSAQVMKTAPQGLNMKFVMTIGPEMEKLKECAPKGRKYYYLSTFAVSPEHQCKGIGSRLLGYCLSMADEQALQTCLISLPTCHSLYLRHGFVDKGHRDIDLNEWDNYRYRGYGLYRNWGMIREPQR